MKTNAKPYNTPFWLMLIIAALTTAWNILLFMYSPSVKVHNIPKTLYIFYSLWPLLLSAEAIIYRAIRKKIIKKSLAIWHIVTMALCFIILPIGQTIFFLILGRNSFSRIDYMHTVRTIQLLRFISFWGFFIIGHAFFIATIAKSFKRKEAEDNEQATGILDGIIDEY